MNCSATNLILLLLCLQTSGCFESAIAKPQRHNNKKLDEFYEIEWIKCVNQLGLDQCRIIQESGFRQCRSYPYRSANEAAIPACAEDRFKDRTYKLFPQEEKPPEKESKQEDPATPSTLFLGIERPVQAEVEVEGE